MNKFFTFTIIMFILVAVVLQGVNIFLTNTRAIEGISAGELTQSLVMLQEENMELESKLLSISSFRNVASKAAEMGLSPNREFVSLYDPVEVARSR